MTIHHSMYNMCNAHCASSIKKDDTNIVSKFFDKNYDNR